MYHYEYAATMFGTQLEAHSESPPVCSAFYLRFLFR